MAGRRVWEQVLTDRLHQLIRWLTMDAQTAGCLMVAIAGPEAPQLLPDPSPGTLRPRRPPQAPCQAISATPRMLCSRQYGEIMSAVAAQGCTQTINSTQPLHRAM